MIAFIPGLSHGTLRQQIKSQYKKHVDAVGAREELTRADSFVVHGGSVYRQADNAYDGHEPKKEDPVTCFFTAGVGPDGDGGTYFELVRHEGKDKRIGLRANSVHFGVGIMAEIDVPWQDTGNVLRKLAAAFDKEWERGGYESYSGG